MKRIGFLMVALLMIGGMAMAQGHRKGGSDKRMDPKAHAERMTERMAKEYSLNDTQKKELLEANLAHVAKVGTFAKGMKSGVKQGKKDKCTQVTDSCCSKKERKRAPKMTIENREKMRKDAKALREDYDAQLKKIMSKEQFDAYAQKQADRQQKRNDERKKR